MQLMRVASLPCSRHALTIRLAPRVSAATRPRSTLGSWRTVRGSPTAAASATDTAVAAKAAGCTAVLPDVAADALDTLDIRVGLVMEAKAIVVEVEVRRGQEVRKRNKTVLLLQVDIGLETRQIVTDVASLDEESAPGKKLMVLANVPVSEVHGHASHGRLVVGTNFDSTPMPASVKSVLPGPGRLPAGCVYTFV